MTEDLKRLLQATEGQPPSADFVARLRAQIVAETEGREAGAEHAGGTAIATDESIVESVREADDEISVVFDLEPPQRVDEDELAARRVWTQGRIQLLAAAAAVVVAVVGIWALILDENSGLDTVDTATTIDAPDPDEEDDGSLPLTTGSTFFDAGTYRIDTLGTGFTFSVEETSGVFLNANGVVTITDLTSVATDDGTLTFRRTSLLPDPSNPTSAIDSAGGWPADDLVGWLEALGDDVLAGDPLETTLGGLDATFVELEVGELSCNRQPDCVTGSPTESPDRPMFTEGSRYRVWVVDQGQEDPIVVIAAIDEESLAAWFDEADAILATVEFESIEPSPVRRATAGSAELAVFGGIRLDLPEDVVIVEPFEGFARLIPKQIGGDVEFLTAPLDVDGAEVTTTDRMLDLLTDEAVELVELVELDIGGFTARTFEVASGSFPNVVLKPRATDLARQEAGWEPPQEGHLWVIEHPELGLLIVSADALDGAEAVAPLRPWTEELLHGLEFGGT